MAHTPGPWIMSYSNDGRHHIYAHGQIATVDSLWDANEQDANARLIALAPDMLALLTEVATVLPLYFDCLDDTSDTLARTPTRIVELQEALTALLARVK